MASPKASAAFACVLRGFGTSTGKPNGAEFQGGLLLGFSRHTKETHLNGPLNVFEH